MDGRAFADVAGELAAGSTEAHWRASAGRPYFALFHEAWGALRRWGFALQPRGNIHGEVRLRFAYSTDPDLRRVGDALDWLVRLRNEADSRLDRPGSFLMDAWVTRAVADSRKAFDLIDQIEADPARRAAAIASIRP